MRVNNPSELDQAMADSRRIGGYDGDSQGKQELIEKVEEMSAFAFDFYKREQDGDAKFASKQALEKLLLINLLDTFSEHKSDFTEAFKLIEEYLNLERDVTILASYESVKAVSRLSFGISCVNLDQKMHGLRLICTMLEKMDIGVAYSVVDTMYKPIGVNESVPKSLE